MKNRLILLFDWMADHRVTGVEVGHIPLLLLTAYILFTLNPALRHVGLFGRMSDVVRMEAWAGAITVIAVVMAVALTFKRWALHRWALGMTATWWFALAVMVWAQSSTWLFPAILVSIGMSALWRVADTALRDTQRALRAAEESS